jgi:hypothetical protein
LSRETETKFTCQLKGGNQTVNLVEIRSVVSEMKHVDKPTHTTYPLIINFMHFVYRTHKNEAVTVRAKINLSTFSRSSMERNRLVSVQLLTRIQSHACFNDVDSSTRQAQLAQERNSADALNQTLHKIRCSEFVVFNAYFVTRDFTRQSPT